MDKLLLDEFWEWTEERKSVHREFSRLLGRRWRKAIRERMIYLDYGLDKFSWNVAIQCEEDVLYISTVDYQERRESDLATVQRHYFDGLEDDRVWFKRFSEEYHDV